MSTILGEDYTLIGRVYQAHPTTRSGVVRKLVEAAQMHLERRRDITVRPTTEHVAELFGTSRVPLQRAMRSGVAISTVEKWCAAWESAGYPPVIIESQYTISMPI